MRGDTILDIKNLSISVGGRVLLKNTSFSVSAGEAVGVFGDSGSGKSVFSLFLLGFLDSSIFSFGADSAVFSGSSEKFDLLSKNSKSWDFFRSSCVSMVFQDPSVSLNPTIRCGKQIEEVFLFSKTKTTRNLKNVVFSLLKEVGLDDFERVYSSFPHELSGGQKQRVVVAVALASNPRLLIADEPTTSLDPSTQRAVLDLILGLKKKRSMGVVLISHDLDLINYFCSRVYFFNNQFFYSSSDYLGKKYLKKRRFFLNSIKNRLFDLKTKDFVSRLYSLPEKQKRGGLVFYLKNVSVCFLKDGCEFLALKSLSFSLRQAEIIGVVGGSGSGKTTFGRVLCGLEKNYSGFFSASDIFLKKNVQMVFQDPFSSFNPKHTVGDSVLDIIILFKSNHSVLNLFRLVGLDSSFINRYPHELSGGEKQRVSIARVLASNPRVIVFDESLSALDTETQYSILNLILFINNIFNISIVFISHDVNCVSFLCKKIIVLRNGVVVDSFLNKNMFSKNRSFYTKKIITDSLFL